MAWGGYRPGVIKAKEESAMAEIRTIQIKPVKQTSHLHDIIQHLGTY
jgi:hypothetical protein